MLPKYFCFIVICFLQAPSNLENHMTVCMGYPAMTPKWESRKTPLKGGRKAMQGERHPKSEITLTRKTRTSSSDFALKFTSYFLKPELPVPKNKIYIFYKIKINQALLPLKIINSSRYLIFPVLKDKF